MKLGGSGVVSRSLTFNQAESLLVWYEIGFYTVKQFIAMKFIYGLFVYKLGSYPWIEMAKPRHCFLASRAATAVAACARTCRNFLVGLGG